MAILAGRRATAVDPGVISEAVRFCSGFFAYGLVTATCLLNTGGREMVSGPCAAFCGLAGVAGVDGVGVAVFCVAFAGFSSV